MVDYEELAELAMTERALTRAQCHDVLDCPDHDVLALLHAVYRVRRHFRGNRVHIQVLSNAKSGLCPEDCHYCSQSSVSTAEVERYPLKADQALLEEAQHARQAGAKRFCMAMSGRTVSDKDLDRLCDVIGGIKAESPISVCCSIGFVTDAQARRLREAGLDRVNHNLNTSERFYPQICTTHSYRDRLANIERCKAAGLEVCSGGIVGQGETNDDIIDMLEALRQISPESLPLNFLIPIPGTPFENLQHELTPYRCLKVLALARLLHPRADIRAAGGREYHLRSLQPLALYAVNSIFVAGYLTTGGQSADEACRMITDLGFELELEGAVAEQPQPS